MKQITTLLFMVLISSFVTAQTWIAHNANSVNLVIAMSFPTADTGYVVTDLSEIRKTVNGATSWTTVTPPAPIWNLYFTTGQKGFVLGDSVLHMTTNGGNTWTESLHDS